MSQSLEPSRFMVALHALPSVLLQSAFFIVPLCMTIALSFQETEFYRVQWVWSLETWTDVFTTKYYWSILWNTILMAIACVIVCAVIGFPIAYALVTRFKRWQTTIKILLVFAFLTDAVLKTFGWVVFLDQTGPANYILSWLGLPSLPDWVLYSRFSALLGMVYTLLPFSIFTIFLSVDVIDRNLLRAAYDCGAGKFRAFWEVTLPLSKSGLMAGALLVFVLSLGSFLEPKVLGGGLNPMAAELIRQTFETRINWPLGSALTIVVISITVITILLASRLLDLRQKGQS
ncbi:ABC transporter permease [Sulfitobacter sp.]|uniref:ABC transporter permease n=1 Tax=Sulfitobacter sp. TaxID=1903071 RepID=UPI003003430D